MATLTESYPTTAAPVRRTFLCDLEGQPACGAIGPNWFASVMGTGIVAIALAGLPFTFPGQVAGAVVVWALSVLVLAAVTAATLTHIGRHPLRARGHLEDPVMSHFYGAPAMALLTVGAGTLLVGVHVIGSGPATAIDAALWTAGTALGLATALVLPYVAVTRHEVRDDSAFGGWLMPIVPPMVSAATGALLVPHLPAGQARETMLLACYAMFGLTLVLSLLVIASVWQRLLRHGIGAAGAVPTLWIVLGPVGQSITATHHLGKVAPGVVPAPYAHGFTALTLVYGVPMWGFAMLWLALAAALTLRTAREHLPFSLTWWSFTFPVGTVVTGTSGLAAATGLAVFQVAAGVLFVGLLLAWGVVAVRTARGVWLGTLLRGPAPVTS